MKLDFQKYKAPQVDIAFPKDGGDVCLVLKDTLAIDRGVWEQERDDIIEAFQVENEKLKKAGEKRVLAKEKSEYSKLSADLAVEFMLDTLAHYVEEPFDRAKFKALPFSLLSQVRDGVYSTAIKMHESTLTEKKSE